MSKRQKVTKIHDKIMVISEQIKVLADFLQNYANNDIQREVLAGIISEKSLKIARTNEKLAVIFKI